ncbi:hypothetical protein HNQ85_001532 [Anoxybacillus calidus]|jgi:YwpF-like protein|uniref:YwpF-like protein n=1 Tax=[Anoxybacillus] calidus TaxID=575178 RepID=A0A7V9YZE5_9BACL|nr:YwpF-like family protein [Anoxybacillus calidus]MBA2871262.1 hypothetical protein [Anoxybacillus calidus]
MKTFKLAALSILHDEVHREDISLIDGLIINKEDNRNRWLIEMYLDKKYEELFSRLQQANEEFRLQVTISHKSNDPANMLATVRSITRMSEHMSVLMDGLLVRNKTDLAEIVLANLVEQGLQGEALLKEFKHQLHERRGIKETVKGV